MYASLSHSHKFGYVLFLIFSYFKNISNIPYDFLFGSGAIYVCYLISKYLGFLKYIFMLLSDNFNSIRIR